LTFASRKASLDNMAGDNDVVVRVVEATERFGGNWVETDPLAAVASARELARAVDEALRAAVQRARVAGRTWQEIGDLLGTTRQAAFQRFGRPIDPRTGALMTQTLLPGAAERAAALFADIMDGRYEQARHDFDDTLREALDVAKLGDDLALVVEMVGSYEGMGEPFAKAHGEFTVVDVPLRFEAGEMIGRISFRADGAIAGLFVLRPEFA
jgi:hypothetical protein